MVAGKVEGLNVGRFERCFLSVVKWAWMFFAFAYFPSFLLRPWLGFWASQVLYLFLCYGVVWAHEVDDRVFVCECVCHRWCGLVGCSCGLCGSD